MRVKLLFEPPLPGYRCWYEISNQGRLISDLATHIAQEFELETEVTLSLDSFELLPNGNTLGLIRDNDLIHVKSHKTHSGVASKGTSKKEKPSGGNIKDAASSESESESDNEQETEADGSSSKKRKREIVSVSSSEESSSSDSCSDRVIKNTKKKSNLTKDKNKAENISCSEKDSSSSQESSDSDNNVDDDNDNESDSESSSISNTKENMSDPRRPQSTPNGSAINRLLPDKKSLNTHASSNKITQEIPLAHVTNSETTEDLIQNQSATPKGRNVLNNKDAHEKPDLRLPLSLSFTSNKKKGYLREMLAVTPTHIRFSDDDNAETVSNDGTKKNDLSPLTTKGSSDITQGHVFTTRVDFERPITNWRKTNDDKRQKIDRENSSAGGSAQESNQSKMDGKKNEMPKAEFDYSQLEEYNDRPSVGDRIAYKVIELSPDFTPELSDFKEATIIAYDVKTNKVTLNNLSSTVKEPKQEQSRKPNKFELQDLGDEFVVQGQEPWQSAKTFDWEELNEVRRMKTDVSHQR